MKKFWKKYHREMHDMAPSYYRIVLYGFVAILLFGICLGESPVLRIASAALFVSFGCMWTYFVCVPASD